jgi:hypothetical protein
MQKRIIRIMTGTNSRVSCRNLFKELGILPFASLYILSLMLFVVKNKHFFTFNSDNYTRSTRQVIILYYLAASLTLYQHGIHYMGVRIFNSLPSYIKDMSDNIKKFEHSLKQFYTPTLSSHWKNIFCIIRMRCLYITYTFPV